MEMDIMHTKYICQQQFGFENVVRLPAPVYEIGVVVGDVLSAPQCLFDLREK